MRSIHIAQTNPASQELEYIRRLLLYLSRPARLLDCIEFDPEANDAAASERAVQQAALKHDIPTYIMGRLTAHFGVKAAEPVCLRFLVSADCEYCLHARLIIRDSSRYPMFAHRNRRT